MNEALGITEEAEYDFVNFLRQEQERAVDVKLDDRRSVAIDFYQGALYGDEVEGRSQVVTRDVSEVVDTMTVGILGTIVASGKVVEFETEPEEQIGDDGQPVVGENGQPVMVDYGEEATAAIQYYFMRKQKGYRILHDSLKAGQIEKSGIVKTYVENQPAKVSEREALAGEIDVGEDGPNIGGVPVVAAEALDEGWQPGMEALRWKVKLSEPQPPKICDTTIPNEFFRVAPDCGADLDEAIYVGERAPKTMSDLVKLGYDPEQLRDIWSSAPSDTVVEQARDSERSHSRLSVGERTGAARLLWLDEEYPLYDWDGDGIAERLFVHRIGSRILKVMPVDEQPYSLWSPFPMQHRLIGQSTADKTMDIQRIRSVLLRQGLDSIYIANSPRTLIDENSVTVDTIDDILTVRAGGLIRYKGGNKPEPLAQNDTSPTAFAAMEMMSSERESRTGLTRQSQGLNPDTTNKTAFGMAMLQQNADKIELYITRNFAEGIVMPIFAKRYRLMRKYGKPFRMKIEGKYRTIDPSKWPEDIDMAINVGLGTGNKDQRLQYRMSLLGVQQAAMQAGLRIVGEEQVYQNIRGLVQDSGIGSPSQYVIDPAALPPQEPQQDPETLKAQAEAEQKQAELQSAHEQALAKLQLQQEAQQASDALKAQAIQQDMDLKAAQAEQAARLAEARASEEARLAQEKQAFEMMLAERRFAFEQEMAAKKHEQAESMVEADLPSNRPGGSLAE